MLAATWLSRWAKPSTWQRRQWLLLAPAVAKGDDKNKELKNYASVSATGREKSVVPRTFPQHGQPVTDAALGHQAARLSSYPWTWSPIEKGKVERFFFTLMDSTWFGQNFHKPLCFTGLVASGNFGPVSLPVNTVTKNIWNQILSHTRMLIH